MEVPNTTSLWLTPPSMAAIRFHKMITLLELTLFLYFFLAEDPH
ncbi:MAG: hypothetical protein P4M14_10765 [Gammaproteobacteria bacterium]|nr:hypothetical protein [Gammaproteobacteria bacterium]